MDAAIGRIHLSITVASPSEGEQPTPSQEEQHLERTLQRDRATRAAEADRTFWNASFYTRGRF